MIPIHTAGEVAEEAVGRLAYVNESRPQVHVLNKFISFDETQESIFRLQPPLIIIGSAGSGKTVLVLEKLKQLKGNVAYVSLSRYLVDNARKMYYSHGYDNEGQEIDFLKGQRGKIRPQRMASGGGPAGSPGKIRAGGADPC
jgi:hypothetical protein